MSSNKQAASTAAVAQRSLPLTLPTSLARRAMNKAEETIVPPSWSMHGWLLSLKLEAVVVAAARKRLDLLLHRKHGDNLTDAEARRFERSYVEHLGQHGSRSNNLLSLSLDRSIDRTHAPLSLFAAATHPSDYRASSSLLLQASMARSTLSWRCSRNPRYYTTLLPPSTPEQWSWDLSRSSRPLY